VSIEELLISVKLKPTHDAVIEAVQQMKVRKVGLVIGPDYDYPLTWRLYRTGVAVRRVFGEWDLEWADILFAPKSRPPATKDWHVCGANSSVLINPQFEKKALKGKAHGESQSSQE
jgi:hypothetical protein